MLAAVKDAAGDRPSTALAADTGVDYDDAAYEREMKAARRQAAADRLAVIQRLNLIAYVNAAVLAFVAVGVGYELLHVDVEAILALFKYTLPEDRPMEDALAYRLATSVDLLGGCRATPSGATRPWCRRTPSSTRPARRALCIKSNSESGARHVAVILN